MITFSHIPDTSKDEQIRAYCIEKAIQSFNEKTPELTERVVRRAMLIEDYIKNGREDNGTADSGA